MHWTEKTKQMFFMASYNIDKFRTFVFESSFLKRYPEDPQTLEKIKIDEVALLEFGLKWLKGLLFKEGGAKAAAPKQGLRTEVERVLGSGFSPISLDTPATKYAVRHPR